MSQAATPIVWLDWADATARARALDRPILLVLGPRWSRASQALPRTLEDDEIVAALIHRGFCPVRLDADRRPDLAGRYGLGEWPSVAFLTPAGALLGGAASTSLPRLMDLLRRVDDAWRTRRAEIERAVQEPQDPRGLQESREPADPQDLQNSAAPLEPVEADEILVLLTRDPAAAREALDRLVAEQIDPDDGGVFREPARARGADPPREKLLAANADVLDLLTHAGLALGETSYLEQARRVASFVCVWLGDPAGGFGAALMVNPTEVDATLYVDANARTVSALVRAGAALDDPRLTEVAIASLERIVLATYRPGDGVAHVCDDPEIRGLLVDQVWLAEALMDAHEATGREPYVMLAAELLHYSARVLWDSVGAGFFDRADPAVPLKPFALNCRAARTLLRAAELCGEPEFADHARRTLEALARAPRLRGADAAALELALRAAARPAEIRASRETRGS